MKQCTHCWQWKDESEFNWRITGIKLWGICRECQRQQKKEYYLAHKDEFIQEKRERVRSNRIEAREYVFLYLATHPCVECGETDPVVLEFDHINPEEKDKSIAQMIQEGVPIATLEREIAKCQVLCANCHRRKSSNEGGWFRSRH